MIAVDLFAGAGGSTIGAEAAGAKVVLAANHWDAAIETHKANHPHTKHWLQDLQQADFRDLPQHDLLLASPSCVGHTRARGAERSTHDASRSTAWAVISAAEVARPLWIIVENVPEFLNWELYPAWEMALKALGYTMSPHIINAADIGVPQHRKRLYLICARSMVSNLHFTRCAHKAVNSVIRWSSGTWRPWRTPSRIKCGIRPLCHSTLARIAKGRVKYGERFLVAYYGSEQGGRSIERPCGSLRTRDCFIIVQGEQMRWLSVPEQMDLMGFPRNYKMPANHRLATHLLGNAVCPPVMTAIVSEIIKKSNRLS